MRSDRVPLQDYYVSFVEGHSNRFVKKKFIIIIIMKEGRVKKHRFHLNFLSIGRWTHTHANSRTFVKMAVFKVVVFVS